MTVPAIADSDSGRWQDDAACRGEPPDVFFPDNDRHVPAEVRALCSMCPVRGECLDHGLVGETEGIWGGMSQHELRRLRRIRGVHVKSWTLHTRGRDWADNEPEPTDLEAIDQEEDGQWP